MPHLHNWNFVENTQGSISSNRHWLHDVVIKENASAIPRLMMIVSFLFICSVLYSEAPAEDRIIDALGYVSAAYPLVLLSPSTTTGSLADSDSTPALRWSPILTKSLVIGGSLRVDNWNFDFSFRTDSRFFDSLQINRKTSDFILTGELYVRPLDQLLLTGDLESLPDGTDVSKFGAGTDPRLTFTQLVFVMNPIIEFDLYEREPFRSTTLLGTEFRWGGGGLYGASLEYGRLEADTALLRESLSDTLNQHATFGNEYGPISNNVIQAFSVGQMIGFTGRIVMENRSIGKVKIDGTLLGGPGFRLPAFSNQFGVAPKISADLSAAYLTPTDHFEVGTGGRFSLVDIGETFDGVVYTVTAGVIEWKLYTRFRVR